MTKSELEKFYNSDEGKEAGLSKKEADRQGIDYGRESAKWILKMKDRPVNDWTPEMWKWANKQNSFISRMSGVKGRLYDDKGRKTRKHLALLIWGHNPEKKSKGGNVKEFDKIKKQGEELINIEPEGLFDSGILKSGGRTIAQTPSPKKDRIFGSKVNKEGSAKSKKSAESIKFSAETIKKLKIKVEQYNKDHKDKVDLQTLKAVYRRGLGAYSVSHRPTITGGRPNTRNAWAMARVNKFLEKKAGKPVKKTYVQDDDLLENGGKTDILLAPNGKPSNLTPEQYKLVRTPEFKAWFGDWEKDPENASKVVDINGEPLVVYHGTNNKYNKFDLKYANKNFLGFWFADNKGVIERGESGAEGIKYIKSFFLNIKKIAKYDEYEEYNYLDSRIVPKKKIAEFKKKFNGIILEGQEEGEPMYLVVFDSNQIKLADGTNTTFDAENPDIRYDDGGQTDTLLAPNGKPSNLTPEQYKLVRTPEFKAWFGDWENDPENASKVVDINGEPLVVYHGSNSNHNEFLIEKQWSNIVRPSYNTPDGFYFAKSKLLADKYGIYVKSYFIGLGNTPINNLYIVVATSPTQIKLADGTNTTFDANNPDIRFKKGGSTLLAPNGKPSNLTPEQWHLVRTPAFKNWFGDWEFDPKLASKVVDQNGEPKVVWHYSKRLLSEADRFNIFKVDNQLGSHFGSFKQAKNIRHYYPTEGLTNFRYYQVFLNIRNPLRMTDEGYFDERSLGRELWKLPTKNGEPVIFNRTRQNRNELNNLKADLLEHYLIDGIVYLNRFESGATDDLIIRLDNYPDDVFLSEFPEAEDSWIAFYPNQIKLADGTNFTFDPENNDIRYLNGGNLENQNITI